MVIKVVRPGLVGDRRTLEGLAAEVRMLERLGHPVVVRSPGSEAAATEGTFERISTRLRGASRAPFSEGSGGSSGAP